MHCLGTQPCENCWPIQCLSLGSSPTGFPKSSEITVFSGALFELFECRNVFPSLTIQFWIFNFYEKFWGRNNNQSFKSHYNYNYNLDKRQSSIIIKIIKLTFLTDLFFSFLALSLKWWWSQIRTKTRDQTT